MNNLSCTGELEVMKLFPDEYHPLQVFQEAYIVLLYVQGKLLVTSEIFTKPDSLRAAGSFCSSLSPDTAAERSKRK